MSTISACIVAFHEEKKIKKCLESIKGVVDEIILVHDGECKDSTLKIASAYTDKIFIRKHIGEAEPHRVFSFKQASGDWILQIDADEYLSNELRKNLRNLAEKENIYAYEFLWPLWDGNKRISKKWPCKRCFFKKNKIFFLGIPHFVAQVNGEVKKIDLILGHRPDYNNYTWKYFKIKSLKRAAIQAKIYLKDFKNIEKFNYNASDWPQVIKIRTKHPLALMPAEFMVTFCKVLMSGAIYEGLIGFKIALRRSFYRVAVNYYIYKLKKQQKNRI